MAPRAVPERLSRSSNLAAIIKARQAKKPLPNVPTDRRPRACCWVDDIIAIAEQYLLVFHPERLCRVGDLVLRASQPDQALMEGGREIAEHRAVVALRIDNNKQRLYVTQPPARSRRAPRPSH
jgi:hypothetical protein